MKTAIRSDDPQAITLLRNKIDSLTEQRDKITSYNKSARKTPADQVGDISLLTEGQRETLRRALNTQAYQCSNGQMPKWVAANLSGNIKSTKDRLKHLIDEQGMPRPKLTTNNPLYG